MDIVDKREFTPQTLGGRRIEQDKALSAL